MPINTILYKKKLAEHTDKKSGESVTLWNVSGREKGGITDRLAQRIFPEFGHPSKLRNERLDDVFSELNDLETIHHAFVGFRKQNESSNFDGLCSQLITSNRILIWDLDADDLNLIDEIHFDEILEVSYESRRGSVTCYLQIETGEEKYTFSVKSLTNTSEIVDAATYLAKEADIHESSKPIQQSPIKIDSDTSSEQSADSENSTTSSQDTTSKEIIKKEKRESQNAHEEARKRDPPVSKGDKIRLGILEFTHHHSEGRQATGKYETFRIFVEDIPPTVEKGDIIEAKIMSFNRKETAAIAVFIKSLE